MPYDIDFTHRAMLGWLHIHESVPLDELSLRMLVPSADRVGVALAFKYVQWLVDERGVSAATEMLSIRSIIQAAKFVHHNESHSRPAEGDKSCESFPVIRNI